MSKQAYVLGFLFSEDFSDVALVKKTKPDWQAGKLNGIGGKIEEGENATDAMVREFEEETGVKIPPNKWKRVVILNGPDWFVYCYTATSNVIYDVKTIEEEEIIIHDIGEIILNMWDIIPNLTWLIPMSIYKIKTDGIIGEIIYK